MIRVLSALVFTALLATQAAATNLYVATTGSDTGNSCQIKAAPCLTGQHAVDQVPYNGSTATIYFADGVYHGPINIYYWRFVSLQGNCANLQAVSLRPAANNQTIVWAQDGAIVSLECLELNGSEYTGITGLAGRQWSIIDYGWLYFSAMPGGTHVAVTTSTASCVSPSYINGGAVVHASAGSNGFLNVACLMTVTAAAPAFSIFAAVSFQSTMVFSGGFGGNAATGIKYSVQDGTLSGASSLPGDAAGDLYGSGTAW